MTFPLDSLYHGTKFAVEGISEALSFEMARIGVKVKIVKPGMIVTDFGGRSFDFQVGEIAEYQSIIDALIKVWQSGDVKTSPTSLVTDVIYQAATDESTTLRRRAENDANSLLDNRKNMKENDFINMIKEQYGL